MKPSESFIEQPVRSLQTMLRVIAIDRNEPSPIIPDGIFNQATMQAVNDFQRREGLPVTGIADNQTFDAIWRIYEDALIRVSPAESIEITLEPNQILSLGASGPYIYLLQSMLIFLSDQHTSIHPAQHTGIYDADTKLAVRDIQALSDLPNTGDTDRLTWKHIVRQFTLNAHHYILQNNLIAPNEFENSQ